MGCGRTEAPSVCLFYCTVSVQLDSLAEMERNNRKSYLALVAVRKVKTHRHTDKEKSPFWMKNHESDREEEERGKEDGWMDGKPISPCCF